MHRAARRIEFGREDTAELRVFFGRGAHQRNGRVPLVELAAIVARRHTAARAKVRHVEAARRNHLRHARLRGRVEPGWAGAQDAAGQFIGPLGGGEIEHAAHKTVANQSFHGRAAGASGMKYHYFVAGRLKRGARAIDAGSGVAEHAGRDDRALVVHGHGRARHAGDCRGGVGENLPAHAVQPGHIHHRGHHGDVARAEIRFHVASRQGEDQQLGHVQGQRAHGSGYHACAAAAAHANHCAELACVVELARQRRRALRHTCHRRATVVGCAQRLKIGIAGARHCIARDVGRKGRRAHHANVEHARGQAIGGDLVAQKGELRAFGVERANDQDGWIHAFFTMVWCMFACPSTSSGSSAAR